MTKLLNVTLALAGALVLAGAAAAQEQAPEAGRLFGGLKDQFTIVLPEGWTVYDQTAAFTGKPSPNFEVYEAALATLRLTSAAGGVSGAAAAPASAAEESSCE